MTNTILNQIMGILVQAILVIFGMLATWGIKAGINYLQKQREFLIQKIGIDNYNLTIDTSKGIYYRLEQQFKFIPQAGALKAAEFNKLLLAKIPGLTQEEIDHFREAVVGEFNNDIKNSKLLELSPLYNANTDEADVSQLDTVQPVDKAQSDNPADNIGVTPVNSAITQ